MKKHSRKVEEQSESSRQSARRDSREVMTELVAQLTKQLDVQDKQVPGAEPGTPDAESPNLNRLTVGVDLGDQCGAITAGGYLLDEPSPKMLC